MAVGANLAMICLYFADVYTQYFTQKQTDFSKSIFRKKIKKTIEGAQLLFLFILHNVQFYAGRTIHAAIVCNPVLSVLAGTKCYFE